MISFSIQKRPFFYIASTALFALSLTYCILVYHAGSQVDPQYGYRFLLGIPNYYFFYLVILPFITAAVLYLAIKNTNIRFFGELNQFIDPDRRSMLLRYRRLLIILAVIISVLVTFDDALDKGHTMAPYSLDFSSMQADSYKNAVKDYFLLKDLPNLKTTDKDSKDAKESKDSTTLKLLKDPNVIKTLKELKILKDATDLKDINDLNDPRAQNVLEALKDLNVLYLNKLKKMGYQGDSVTDFSSLSSWYKETSTLYKMESFLSWLAALIMSIFFAEIFLTIIVKDYVHLETKNLILWLLILCSFWIPTKKFSVYYYSLNGQDQPAIVWFAIILLAVAVILAVFMKVEENDISKYATIIAGILSTLITAISFFSPEYFEKAFVVVQNLSWTFGGILLFVFGFSIYLLTDHLIRSYEKKLEKTSSDTHPTDHDDNKSA